MDERDGVKLLFTIVKEYQHAFEAPVILFTPKDYVDDIFQSFVHLRQALLNNAPPEKISQIVTSFHINWLVTVHEIEEIKKRIKELPRDYIFKSIDFTKHHTHKRYSHIRKYIDSMRSSITDEEQRLMRAELNIVKEMQEAHHSALLEKQTYIRSQADQTEYFIRVQDEIEELMNWLDRLYNSVAVQFCTILKVPIETNDLTKPLKLIIEEVVTDLDPDTQKLIETKGETLTNTLCIGEEHEMEILNIAEKIKVLEKRMSQLQNQNSSTLLALKLKILYLEERLESLETVHASMKMLQRQSQDLKHVSILNHLLPHQDRCRLVKQLVQLWNATILNIIDLSDTFFDEKGNYYVDKHGRKIYSKPDDDLLYQLNDKNELVPVSDDSKHVYYYDECGRYYLNTTSQRVYKDHEGACEYVMGNHGYLVKVSEHAEGVDYYFDRLGRYYINENGHHIYCEDNSTEEYENDGLGNLVRINQQEFYYDPCPKYEMTVAENEYLKEVVGEALKTCIADVVLHQPSNPVTFLADCLVQFRQNVIAREKRDKDEREMFAVQSFSVSSVPAENPPTQNSTNFSSDFSSLYGTYESIDTGLDLY